MPELSEKVSRLISFVKLIYPSFTNIDDERFREAEITYKYEASELAKKDLAGDVLKEYLDRGKFDDFVKALEKVARSTNLLFLGAPRTGDLSILYEDSISKADLCHQIYQLLHGPGLVDDRLDDYLSYVAEQEVSFKWTFPTYYLFLLFPDSEIFIKPSIVRWLLEFLEFENQYSNNPDLMIYQSCREAYQAIRENTVDYGIESMIDVQGLVYVAAVAERGKSKPKSTQEFNDQFAEPFKWMFKNLEEANFAFDWIREAMHILGISDADDPRTAFTLRYRDKQHILTFSFGNWLVVRFGGRDQELSSIMMALFQDDYIVDPGYVGKFSQKQGEQPVNLASFSFRDLIENEDYFRTLFQTSLEYIKQRFSDWEGSPFHHRSIIDVGKVILNEDLREELLFEGVTDVDDAESDEFEEVVQYWKISPGREAWNWENCRENSFIAIGWDEVGDISELNRDQFESRISGIVKDNPNRTETGFEQLWKFRNISENDLVIANQGTTKVLGIGVVTGDYYYENDQKHGHRLPVDWIFTEEIDVNQGGWRRTLIELQREDLDEFLPDFVKELIDFPSVRAKDSYFSIDTFRLLDELHNNPHKDFYFSKKDDFYQLLINPMKDFYAEVANRLPMEISHLMETEKYLFSQILKNDFGQGGAYDYYWGAFYNKGFRRTTAPQLSIVIDKDQLELGFYFGERENDFTNRFLNNCQEHLQGLVDLLGERYQNLGFIYGDPAEKDEHKRPQDLEGFLQDPESFSYDISYFLSREEVLSSSADGLIQICLDVYIALFPMVLLATFDDPMARIIDYLDHVISDELVINPPYSIQEIVSATNYEKEIIARWLRAIRRKGQAVLYGPPGTGKTYLAKQLAKHLIGGGFGFSDLIQFHPSYAYEDFMQGIRPKVVGNGESLIYELIKGRFIDFCEKARSREGISVLIIDEINRANLSRVFGELMYLLEYRQESIPLAGGDTFNIPENVFIIGTMNTADRSIALVDHALRRRFAFLELAPNLEVLDRYYEGSIFDVSGLVNVLSELNDHIGDKNYAVGVSFFLIEKDRLEEHIEDIWRMEVEPYLEEYFFDQPDKVDKFRWERVENTILLP